MNYVLGFAFNKDFREVLLILKNKPEWQKGLYNGIGGKIEYNESSIEAMVREFKEECNIETKEENWKWVCQMGDYKQDYKSSTWQCDVYAITLGNLNSYKDLTDEKCAICVIRTPDEQSLDLNTIHLPSNCIKNLKWLIPMCIDSYDNQKTVSVTYKG